MRSQTFPQGAIVNWRPIDGAEDPWRNGPRKSRVIELRFFEGLSVEETVEVLKIPTEV